MYFVISLKKYRRVIYEGKKRGCRDSPFFCVIGNCDAISYYIKTLREDAQTAKMELIAAQYRGRARVLQAKLFVPIKNRLQDIFM